MSSIGGVVFSHLKVLENCYNRVSIFLSDKTKELNRGGCISGKIFILIGKSELSGTKKSKINFKFQITENPKLILNFK